MGIINSSCTDASKMVSPAVKHIFQILLFPAWAQESQDRVVLPGLQLALRMLRPEPSDAVTNLPTVISLLFATSSCSSRNFHICLMRGGALSLVLSVAFSSLGVRNGHLHLSCVKRFPIDSSCFLAAATFFP